MRRVYVRVAGISRVVEVEDYIDRIEYVEPDPTGLTIGLEGFVPPVKQVPIIQNHVKIQGQSYILLTAGQILVPVLDAIPYNDVLRLIREL